MCISVYTLKDQAVTCIHGTKVTLYTTLVLYAQLTCYPIDQQLLEKNHPTRRIQRQVTISNSSPTSVFDCAIAPQGSSMTEEALKHAEIRHGLTQ